jgi:hypothetical protein
MRRPQREKAKTINVMTAGNTDGYGKLFTVLSVFQSPSWWIDTGANVHVCADISMFTSYQAAWDSSVLRQWVTCLCSWCWHGRSEVHFGEDHAAEEHAACPFYEQESY